VDVTRQRRLPQVVKGFDMDKRWLVNRDMRGASSALSFTDRDGVRYLDQAWLRKATDIVEGKRRNIK
jgi:hypothetical protein